MGDSSPNICEDYDKKEQNACIKCNEVGKMLVCTEIGCPVAIHEGCLNPKANYDDSGNFYCPYCAYKRAVDKVKRFRKKAISAKEELSKFLKVADVDSFGGKEPGNETKKAAGESSKGDVFEFDAGENVEMENHESHNVSEGSKDGEQKANPPKSKTNVRKNSSHKKKVKNVLPSQKRTRLTWTAEEEEMLKDGVQMHAKQKMKNMPWRKILQLGSKVFHRTRNPVDLQNKWKNMNMKK